jgi:glycosyltransferase involved in cell wall biosynthesis
LLLDYDVHVLGTTHDGSPYSRTDFPYDIYPISFGVANVVTKVKPSVVVIQHDPWQVRGFMTQIGRNGGSVPIIATMPIDGKNCRCDYLNGLDLAIWWTDFAVKESRIGGYEGPSTVIPLGVDTDVFKPLDRIASRRALGFPSEMEHAFVVGYIARNQPRKRMDLAVHHFASWVKERQISNAYLYLQTAATGEAAYDVDELMRYERLSNRLIHVDQGYRQVHSEAKMAVTYNALDVFWSTTQGEGFGLPALEAMACGTPCILPNWSAYGDWAAPAAHLVRVGDVSGTINSARPVSGTKVAIYGAVPDRQADIAALDLLYQDAAYRDNLIDRSLTLAADPRYRWQTIGTSFREAVRRVLTDGPLAFSDLETVSGSSTL